MIFYLKAFASFFKIGLFTIGGGYAMVPLIEEEVVNKKKWISQEEFIDLLAISQSVPGVFAVNFSIFIGYKLRRFPGALALALGTILPSFFIILAIALFFQQFKEYEAVEKIFKGIRPAVGYPSLPDQKTMFLMDELIGLSSINIRLTENGAMYPQSSVCGIYIANKNARYFVI